MSLGCSPGFLLYQTFRLTGAKKAQKLNGGGFLGTCEGSVFLKNFEASVFLRVFVHAYTHASTGFYPLAPEASRRRGGAARRRMHPYSLYIRPHGKRQRVIANAAAGVADPARACYIESRNAAEGEANARRVCNYNCALLGDAHRPVE